MGERDFETRLSASIRLFATAAEAPPVDARAVATRALAAVRRQSPWQRMLTAPAAWMPTKPAVSRLVMASAVMAVAVIAALLVVTQLGRPDPFVLPPATQPPTPSPSPAPITGTLPAEQVALVASHAAAINARDAEALAEVFAADGAFDPRGTFAASSSFFSNSLPLTDRHLLEPWLAIGDEWDFAVEIVQCDSIDRSEFARIYGLHSDDADDYGHCTVKSRWHKLWLDVRESWFYEFEGPAIRFWGQTVADANPPDRALPMDLGRLLEWEAWLGSAQPDVAARLLNPRVYPTVVPCGGGEPPCEWTSEGVDVDRISSDGDGRGQGDWSIAGYRFWPSALIPYDPALADEIQDSIAEFLRNPP